MLRVYASRLAEVVHSIDYGMLVKMRLRGER